MTSFAASPFITVDEFFDDDFYSCGFTEGADDALVELLIDDASDILAFASGGRMRGRVSVTWRPVFCGFSDLINELVGTYAPGFNGTRPLPLPDSDPTVVEVVVDGVVLSASEYRLVDGNLLVRTGSAWPTGNDLELDDTEEGTWSVTVEFGAAPNRLTKIATMSLVRELGAPYIGMAPSLPDGVTSASIQGASISLETAAERLRDGIEDATQAVQRFLGIYGRRGAGGVSGVWAPNLDDWGWTFHTSVGASGS